MLMVMMTITQVESEIIKLLDYDNETNVFFWRLASSPRHFFFLRKITEIQSVVELI
jgi:hypothetical protein